MKNRVGQSRDKISRAITPVLEIRHFSSSLNSRFNGSKLSFAEYIAQSRDMIRKVRAANSVINLNKAVDGNSPFELEPAGADAAGKEKKYRRGILLTHGLSDSPYFMRHVAAFFQSRGFRVLAVLLPGHGTRPGDMLDVTWQEWARTVAYGTDKLANEVDELYLGGYSAGGALSIYQSLHDQRVRGLFLFAPALDITHKAAFASWHRLVSWLIPRVKWLEIKPDRDLYKYESFAINTAAQMYALTQVVSGELQQHELNIPIFTVASEDDKTIHTSAVIDFMAAHTHPGNKLIIYTTDAKKVSQGNTENKIEWVNSVLAEQKILGSAHTAIMVPFNDEHYGFDGEYASCAHYYPDDIEKYIECTNNPRECWQGEATEENMKAVTLRRLMYNPHFAELEFSLRKFTDRLK
jgi:esterase/lipase